MQRGSTSYGSAFTWNEFLTKEIRKHLGNTLWTVALVHGFFKQVKLSRSGCKFNLTLIARQSRLHSGPRFLKHGLNDEGHAANYFEIEQIVCGEICGRFSYKVTSIVQNRGSAVLDMEGNYKTMRIHFEKLSKRYGDPIVVLILLKKKPRESVLGQEYLDAVISVNTCLPKERKLVFISMDLDGHFQWI